MKAYLAKTKHRYIDSKDVLILAKTKKDALSEFKTLEDRYNAEFSLKNFTEVPLKEFSIRTIEMHGNAYQYVKSNPHPIAQCFGIYFDVRANFCIPDTTILAETDATYAEALKIFKEQNEEVLALFEKGDT